MNMELIYALLMTAPKWLAGIVFAYGYWQTLGNCELERLTEVTEGAGPA